MIIAIYPNSTFWYCANMRIANADTFALDNFEGPLDFLFHLIQKNEIDIYEISLQEIMRQFLTKHRGNSLLNADGGAEFIGTAASLLLLKSKMLLPKYDQVLSMEEQEADPRFEIIHQLIDYCRFKDMAKVLAEREDRQGAFFVRGTDEIPSPKKTLGIEHLSLNDLAALFQQVIAKTATHTGSIQEEIWRVSDKINLIRRLLQETPKIPFFALFTAEQPREELIATFLAILELMKMEELCAIKEEISGEIILSSPRTYEMSR